MQNSISGQNEDSARSWLLFAQQKLGCMDHFIIHQFPLSNSFFPLQWGTHLWFSSSDHPFSQVSTSMASPLWASTSMASLSWPSSLQAFPLWAESGSSSILLQTSLPASGSNHSSGDDNWWQLLTTSHLHLQGSSDLSQGLRQQCREL